LARKVAWIVSIVLLVVSGVSGVLNGLRELRDANTPLQRSVTIGVLVYGFFGLAAAAGLLLRRSWSVWLAAIWALVVTYVSSAAALAFAGSNASIVGAISGGIGAALIGAGIVWTAAATTRDHLTSEPAHSTEHRAR
jgi:hypothetical protein